MFHPPNHVMSFILPVSCRFRGFVVDGGFDANNDSVTVFGVTYWQVQLARLAFVVVFEVSVFEEEGSRGEQVEGYMVE